MRLFFLFIAFFSSLTPAAWGQTISKTFSIPGFIQVNDTLFISTSEVSIRDYAFFLTHIKKQDSSQFSRALPDSIPINWRVKSYDDAFSTTYDEIYEINENGISWRTWIWFYPIVNVTKQQANLYCKYLTQNYLNASKYFNKKEKKKLPQRFIYRLPTESEWVSIAASFLDTTLYPLGLSKTRKRNTTPISIEYFNDTTGFESHPLGSQSGWNYGLKNDLGVFNMVGNVSEIVADSDNVLGGSFLDPVSACKVTSRKKFIRPESFIGFRVVGVIRK